jgi:hypothetical protein
MAERDISNPPNFHPLHILDAGREDLTTHLKSPGETRRYLEARGKRHAALEHRRRDLAFRRAMLEAMHHPRDRKLGEADRRSQNRNPLYARALDASSASAGGYRGAQQGLSSVGHILTGSQPYSNQGSGTP